MHVQFIRDVPIVIGFHRPSVGDVLDLEEGLAGSLIADGYAVVPMEAEQPASGPVRRGPGRPRKETATAPRRETR